MLYSITKKKLICILDFSNIAHENYDYKTAKINNYVLVKNEIKSIFPDAEIIPIADARTRHVIDNIYKYEGLRKRDRIIQAPAGETADYYIISFAEKSDNSLIFSNDLFRDYKLKNELKKKLIHYKIIEGIVIFSSKLKKFVFNYKNKLVN